MWGFFFSFTIENGWKDILIDNPRDVEELQRMFLESNEGNDRVECENESDLEDEDYVEFCSEDSDTEQDISSEKSEDELDVNEEYFFGKDKEPS